MPSYMDDFDILWGEGDPWCSRNAGVEPNKFKVVAWNQKTRTLVVLVPGHRYWSSLTNPSQYARQEMAVYRLRPKGKGVWTSKLLVEWEPATARGR